MSAEPVLVRAQGLVKRFPGAAAPSVDGVDLTIRRGEVVGLVGESGSGKSTLGRMLLGLTGLSAGEVRFDGVTLAEGLRRDTRLMRRRMQIIFQNPAGALSPRRTVAQSVAEPLVVQGLGRTARHRDRVAEALERVGLDASYAGRYPHELSGGQRQRVSMARALILKPDFVVADEPVSALDVSVQAQVLNLFRDLAASSGFAMLFISHDLAVVNYLADRVLVMHRGKIVESGPREAVIFSPAHAYTRRLLEAHDSLGEGTA